MTEQEEVHLEAHEKLKILKSPVINDQTSDEDDHDNSEVELPNLRGFGDRKEAYENTPEFQRHEDASLLELFYDLFFAANYSVFSETQSVSSRERFKAYVGYFCLLWMTWMMVGFYDVRFLTDSIVERFAKAIHLGVMVGFAVVAPHFDPEDQERQTFRTMSLILFVSRIALAVEYGSILWHVRKFKRAQTGLYVQVGLHIFAAIIYLGVTFSFTEGKKHGHGFMAWYVLSVTEALTTLVLSNVWPVLSFTNTHLMRRMALLTVIVLGDGIVVLATNVVTIVEGPDAWNSATIVIVASASATIYFLFLVYFDWMKHDHLPAWRQQLWTTIHFPFHLALVLFVQGFIQFVLWSKIVNELGHSQVSTSVLGDPGALAMCDSQQVVANVSNVTYTFFEVYPPKIYDTWKAVDDGITNLTKVPDHFWPQYVRWQESGLESDYPSQDFVDFVDKVDDVAYIISAAMENALFETFNIDFHSELAAELEKKKMNLTATQVEAVVNMEYWGRYVLVFRYGYIAGGCALALMVMLTIVSRVTPWKPWPIARVVVNLLLALGMGLVPTLYYHPNAVVNFLDSTWVLPTITLVWLVVLVLTHIGKSPPVFFSKSAAGLFNFTHRRAPSARPTTQYDPLDSIGIWNGRRKPIQEVQQMELGLCHPSSSYEQTGYDGSGYGDYPITIQTRHTDATGIRNKH